MTAANEWSAAVGDAWAQEWRRTDRSFAALTPALMAAVLQAAPDRGRAVDIGCGAGETALALAAARPGLDVTGIDVSDELLAVAGVRGASYANLTFRSGDASAAVAALAPVDLYLSRHGVMFFPDPVAAFTALRAAAAPGAHLVFSCFRDWRDNAFAAALAEATGEGPPDPIAPGPFAFADRARVTHILAEAGWTDIAVTPVDYAYRAGAGDDPVADALGLLSRIGPAARALRLAREAERPAMRDRLRNVITRFCDGGAVDFPAAAWIWWSTAGERRT